MGSFNQIELPLFVIGLLANAALAVVVIRYAPKNLSRYIFALFVLSQMLWISSNYSAFHTKGSEFLWSLRAIYFFASFHSCLFFLFVYSFLKKNVELNKVVIITFSVIATIVSLYSLTPLVIEGIHLNERGDWVPMLLPGIGLWTLFVITCISSGLIQIIRRMSKAEGIEKKQWKFLMIGLSITFILVIIFSFINPIFFENITSARVGHIYTFPFIFFTTYAMVRHHLLNLKTVLAELAVILLNFLLLIKFITSENPGQFLTNGFVLVGAIILGTLLVQGVYREIKQREQLEILTKQLEDANTKLKDLDKARAEFISIASHQLRTPPATIKWYLAAIKSGDYGKFDSGVGETLVKAEITNNAQISLIDDLLNASRIERGKMEFLFEEGDFIALTQMAYDQLVPQAAMKKLELKFNRPVGTFPLVIMDKEKLRQVINNFIDNAIKYTKQGGVVVNIFSDNQNIGVKVTDTGKGFSPEIGPVLFEKYTRGKDSVMHSQGLGLGLYVAKVIIEKHNGKIWAESPGEGKGSTFSFSVPIHNTITPSSTSTLDLTQSQGEHK